MRDPVALLPGLLAAYSPTGFEDEAVDFLFEAMQVLGFNVGYDAIGNAVGSRGSGPNEILLLGHIDTVPGVIPVRRDGDRLYGRGAVDAKGSLACFATAGAAVDLPDGWKITVIGAVGEEGDSRGARYLCENYPAPRMVVIGEPSGWDHITLGYKGTFRFKYEVQKPLTHTAASQESACEQAFRFWNGVVQHAEKWNAGKPRTFEQLTPTLRGMVSGQDDFIDSAELRVGFRLPPGVDRQELEGILAEHTGDGQIFVQDYIPAYKGEKNSVLVRGLLSGIRSAGGQPAFSLKTGTSDMNLVGPLWNCPIVAYGPGDSGLDHTPEEHILVSEYLAAVQVLKQALEKVTQEEK